MKTKNNLWIGGCLTIVCAALTLIPVLAQDAEPQETAIWKFSDPQAVSGKIRINENVRHWNLTLEGGSKVVEDLDAPGGKCVGFDGSQSLIELRNSFLLPEDGVKIELKFKAQDYDGMVTLFQIHQSFELRYYPDKKKLEFIAYYGDEKKFIVAWLPVPLHTWSTVTATLQNKTIKLNVNGKENKAEMPEDMRVAVGQQVLWVACSGKTPDGVNRPFVGELSDIKFTVLRK